jgi:pyridoxal phosphate enzyme (YggS family)
MDCEIDLLQNIESVRQRIVVAAKKREISPEEIALAAVTKTVSPDIINQAVQHGIKIIGENKIQEARDKFTQINTPVEKHMIGHLQRNKVKYAVKMFDMIQSVDSLRLAEEINHRTETRMPILIEVNTSGESSKYGCAPEQTINLLKQITSLLNLEVRGFMTIGLFTDDLEKVRPCFKMLKQIYDEARELDLPNSNISILSMGMTADFETAIEEGANMVRIGTAIFGPRTVN